MRQEGQEQALLVKKITLTHEVNMTKSAGKTIKEPSQELRVCRETEVLVVGGGPAGVAAAIAAARKHRHSATARTPDPDREFY